jgi:hypothetical protein
MEDRFYKLGENYFQNLKESNPGVDLPDGAQDFLTKFAWAWFIADMSDSYSTTLKEQANLKESFTRFFGPHVKPLLWIR